MQRIPLVSGLKFRAAPQPGRD